MDQSAIAAFVESVATAPTTQTTRGLTTKVLWYFGENEVVGVVPTHFAKDTELALAHGLFHAGQRRLILVLPVGHAFPTLYRLPWLTSSVDVYEHDDTTIAKLKPLTKDGAVRTIKGEPKKYPALYLREPQSSWVRELTEWATSIEDLDASHLSNLRAWSYLGQVVLRITKSGRTLTVAPGIRAKNDRAPEISVNGPIPPEELEQIKVDVRTGIARAKQQEFGAFGEHKLQQALRRQPSTLGFEGPLLREVPAWRPKGDGKGFGRGYIDLVGLDSVGDIVLVETKLDHDAMLVLQGLDYFIWAQHPQNRAWLDERLNASPSAKVRLLYAVGTTKDRAPSLIKYCDTHLEALDDEIAWRVALLTHWQAEKQQRDPIDVTMLGQREIPN